MQGMLWTVSIHAPWEGCDFSLTYRSGYVKRFNSRTLGRVRRYRICFSVYHPHVSIHAPWEGCDGNDELRQNIQYGFNSRTLGRVRLKQRLDGDVYSWFQFTHPGKGATPPF